MSAVAYSSSTGQDETVEELVRYAAAVFEANGLSYPPARMSKIIRRERGLGNDVRVLIDTYVARSLNNMSWAGFELFTVQGYPDPTGAHAAHNVDRERGSA